MDKIIGKLFSDYLSEQNIATDADYSLLSKKALEKEKELRNRLNEEQTKCFEELFEIYGERMANQVKKVFG